ncbi:predicted protein [Lichtheimia corymbifera JMRC:FSU:9682]|uniref:Uncharacterized protein n=1 Tax=Lichtheimia corymbifera JMRC:FSU:9682 TaxID=1263082 RepID=A0A068RIA5_9FUNG|nr:predicted protein [Lichtheimia corymbifera JMRC:FSU:9682]
MKRGLFHRTILLGRVERTLCATFAIKARRSPISQCHRQPRQEVDRRFTLAGGDIAKSVIGEVDHETSTQDTFGHDEQLCSIEEPTLHCKF